MTQETCLRYTGDQSTQKAIMDPKKEEAIRQQIAATVGLLNRMAILQYARLLMRCGVAQPRIFNEFFLP